MTTYGVLPTGFLRKTIDNIIAEMEADELAEISTDLDVSTTSVVGQLNGIVARQLGLAWEQLELVYHAFDADAAEGRLLDMLGKLTGTFRLGSTPSKVIMTCDLDSGTELEADVHFVNVDDQPDLRFTPDVNYTAGVTGLQPVTFRCEQLGPISAFAGTINVINTPLGGWRSAVNPDDAELGTETDTDPAFRRRRDQEIATVGSATIRAVTANILQAFGAKLQSLVVFENDNDSVDEHGLLPHSLEVLIFDGDIPAIANNDLAQVIFDSKAGGIHTSGNVTGQANALVNGVETTKDVKFSRAEQLELYIDISLVKKLGQPYVGDNAVKDTVATMANAYFGPGDYVIRERLEAFALSCAGVQDMAAELKLGLTASPTATDNVPVSIRQTARFSSSRITVHST